MAIALSPLYFLFFVIPIKEYFTTCLGSRLYKGNLCITYKQISKYNNNTSNISLAIALSPLYFLFFIISIKEYFTTRYQHDLFNYHARSCKGIISNLISIPNYLGTNLFLWVHFRLKNYIFFANSEWYNVWKKFWISRKKTKNNFLL